MNRRFAFAQARVQARIGRRPGPAVWQQLAQIGEFGLLVQQIKGHVSWSRAVFGIDAESDAHRIEYAIREDFSQQVRELSHWLPSDWAAALDWVEKGPSLAVARYLLLGCSPEPWMSEDPVIGPLALADATERHRLVATGPYRALAARGQSTLPLAEIWQTCWRSTWPSVPGRIQKVLQSVGTELVARFAITGHLDADDTDQRTDRSLLSVLRFHAGEPPAIFAYLGLVLQDLQRLRGLLLCRRLLPAVGIR